MEQITIHTKSRIEFVEVTSEVRGIARKAGVKEGVCYLFAPHTTAGVTINEHADPSVMADLKNHLATLVPPHAGFLHSEGNSDAHIKAALVGSSQSVMIHDGSLALGTWQGIFFCEFDGPRTRTLWVKVLAG